MDEPVSVREHLTALIAAEHELSDMRLRALDDAVKTAFWESRQAIEKAEAATEKRFESVNEFRAVLTDQAATFVTRAELNATVAHHEANYERNREDIHVLANRINLRDGETAGTRLTTRVAAAGLAALGTLISIVIVLANVWTTHRP